MLSTRLSVQISLSCPVRDNISVETRNAKCNIVPSGTRYGIAVGDGKQSVNFIWRTYGTLIIFAYIFFYPYQVPPGLVKHFFYSIMLLCIFCPARDNTSVETRNAKCNIVPSGTRYGIAVGDGKQSVNFIWRTYGTLIIFAYIFFYPYQVPPGLVKHFFYSIMLLCIFCPARDNTLVETGNAKCNIVPSGTRYDCPAT